ncbi:MAG: 2-oxo acid dehydrogenase subunit E2 [Paracoccaceae bacterium]|jgi:pyruvate/2-oxoglutarate dehydrogenase complex dihydrolipoamide acyltransferase (E2) component|nr:2-oxo acid dehydrogenase subunit E2 [Paracoccaceae bacterium]
MGAIASPSVRRLALSKGIDIDALAARLGRETITRDDISGGSTSLPSGTPLYKEYWDVDHSLYGPVSHRPLNRMALVALKTLTAAQQLIPAVTHHDSADVTRIETTRAQLKQDGIWITALAFHVVVLARCLKEYETFNASLSPDGQNLILKSYVNIGIAVDTPQGLIVPVIRNVDQKRIQEISDEIADFGARARARRIRAPEMGGASMSISSLGGIGGEAFSPIVNPPEVAILGINRTEMRPVWDGQIFVPRRMVPLDLSYDHRVVNGADAARFLNRYRYLINNADDLVTGIAGQSE